VIYGGEASGARWDDSRRDRRRDRDRRAERDGDDDWVRVCVLANPLGGCLRSELRRR
jgi:hypothetical protein